MRVLRGVVDAPALGLYLNAAAVVLWTARVDLAYTVRSW